MTRPTARAAGFIAPAIALALVAAACGSSKSNNTASTNTTAGNAATTKEAPISATLNGSGSTFAQPFYQAVIQGYKSVQPGVTINYAGGGSGTGRQNLHDGVVDYAGSDAPIAAADLPGYKGDVLYFPTMSGPITVSYNLPDVKTLNLDADTIAKIFQRTITKWDDPAIAALNSGTKLPSTAIVVAHRSDGSGTTQNFTGYLQAAVPNTWTLKSGSTVEWPADTQAGNGNQGVAQIVKSTTGAVGYVDFSDAKAAGLQFASLKNAAGKIVAPTVDGASAALAATTVNADLTYNPLNASGDTSYPITSPTWIIVYKNQADKNKGAALKSFLTYLLNDGQKMASTLDYAPLPPSLQQKAVAQLSNLVVPTA
jgi:phosphate transport system substrate-binding protein